MSMLMLLLLASEAGAVRCDDLLVTPSATKLEVLSKCGEPDFRERVSGADEAPREVWIYDRPETGAQKILHFDGVRLERIDNARTTRPRAATGAFRCRNEVVQPGVTKLTVRRLCGEPELTETVSASEETRREIWLYSRDAGIVELEFKGVELERVTPRAH